MKKLLVGTTSGAGLARRERLDAYPFYWAALGDLALRQGQRTKASEWLARALACARTETERELFLRRIDECTVR